mmetsp:Transcript_69965/g.138699  ORF Transcript_69965/g.138699 Transcript_69965/m.138699 type:complete len:91 (+) Transcript_69965:259-531(+)
MLVTAPAFAPSEVAGRPTHRNVYGRCTPAHHECTAHPTMQWTRLTLQTVEAVGSVKITADLEGDHGRVRVAELGEVGFACEVDHRRWSAH